MERITLKNKKDSIELPRLCLGSGMDYVSNAENAMQVMDAYFEKGNFIDTARIYGNFLQNGKGGAEETIGKYLKSRGLTSKAIVASKGGHPMILNMKGSRLGEKDLTRDIEESLKFLQRDYIDVYFLHRDNDKVDLYTLMKTLDGFVRSGKLRFLGASNWTLDRINNANKIARENGFAEFAISQICYSLAETTSKKWKDETLFCMDSASEAQYIQQQFPVMAFSSLARGFFAKYKNGQRGLERYWSEANIARADRVTELAAKFNVPVNAVVARYLIDNPLPTIAVFSTTKAQRVEEIYQTESFKLSPEELQFLQG